ncbi:hypothetical protein [Sphingobium sp. CECT 9361]|uniref:hypothetical protein n=1 Tax=Sphingobium sp. CECT 9361 TaxID=2845384 RepID=UPI001E45C91E|nr:hypothetical protein [Sphingobium sp. CECT 9361]CAH0351057.1 hypothetical protein SPH9361_01415 [Sphingobium sp. CECT 9361]
MADPLNPLNGNDVTTSAKRTASNTAAEIDGAATKIAADAKTTARKVAADVESRTAGKKGVKETVKASAASVKAAAVKATENVDWKAHGEQLKDQATKTARNAADAAKEKTGSAMQNLSKLISDTASTVDAKLGPQYGDYARYAAEAVAGAAKSLDEKDVDQLVGDARDFVRKSPAVAIGAAAVVGFVLMRLAKGSDSSDKA